jgi:photosystem II stability/assembly factor-like uncharacterized protein
MPMRICAATFAAIVIACRANEPDAIAQVQSIVAFEGLSQTAVTGEILSTPVSVQVIRADGSLATDIEVMWAVDPGDGTLGGDAVTAATSAAASVTARTSAAGRSAVWWKLGSTARDQKLTATVTGSPALSATVTAKALGVLGMHYDGAKWTYAILDSGALQASSLTAVWGASPSSITVLGTNCFGSAFLVLRYNGFTWDRRGIDFTSPFDTWQESATGSCPTGPLSAGVSAVMGRSTSDVFMLVRTRVSQQQQWQIRHFDGNAWTRQYTHGNGLLSYGALNGIWVDSDREAYVAGGHATNESGAIRHYDGSAWTTIYSDTSKGFNGIWGTSVRELTVVGTTGTILHFDGNAWSPQGSGTLAELRAVHGLTSNDLVAVGDGGVILRYNGSAWTAEASGTSANLYAVRVISPTSAFAVGDGGVVVRYDGSKWAAEVAHADVSWRTVWGLTANDVYVFGTPKR